MIGESKMPSPEELAKLKKQRVISDAELLREGAEIRDDDSIEITKEQHEKIKEEMEREIWEKADKIYNWPDKENALVEIGLRAWTVSELAGEAVEEIAGARGDLNKLHEFLGDNEEAANIIDELRKSLSKINDRLIQRINCLSQDAFHEISHRDSLSEIEEAIFFMKKYREDGAKKFNEMGISGSRDEGEVVGIR